MRFIENNGIRTHLFQEIYNILNNYQGFYNPQLNGYDQAGEVNFDSYTDIPRNMQYATIAIGNQKLTIFNLHGLWTKDKEDNNLRIKQSNKVRSFMKKFDCLILKLLSSLSLVHK